MHEFLEVSRNSDLEQLKSLIKLGKSGKNLNSEDIKFDINYRGKSKRFYGWTALHITCYFNHLEAVKLLLQVNNLNLFSFGRNNNKVNCLTFPGKNLNLNKKIFKLFK